MLNARQAYGFVKEDRPSGLTDADVTANKLKKTTASEHFDTGKIYLFYKGEFVLNAAGDLAAGKVYLDLDDTNSNPAPRLGIMANETTGITDTQREPSTSDSWYTLSGRKLSGKPTSPGLYLNRGRKVVIK